MRDLLIDWRTLSAPVASLFRAVSRPSASRELRRLEESGSAVSVGRLLPWRREAWWALAGFPARLLPHAAFVADAARVLVSLFSGAKVVPENVLREGPVSGPSSWRVPDLLLVLPSGAAVRIEIQRSRKARNYFARELRGAVDALPTVVLLPPWERAGWYEGVRSASILDEAGIRAAVSTASAHQDEWKENRSPCVMRAGKR